MKSNSFFVDPPPELSESDLYIVISSLMMDAARYRFLKSKSAYPVWKGVALSSDRDSAIDEIMNEEKRLKVAADFIKRNEEERLARIAALPEGSCEECYGEGEVGGQFCGGIHECEVCGGTGKAKSE